MNGEMIINVNEKEYDITNFIAYAEGKFTQLFVEADEILYPHIHITFPDGTGLCYKSYPHFNHVLNDKFNEVKDSEKYEDTLKDLYENTHNEEYLTRHNDELYLYKFSIVDKLEILIIFDFGNDIIPRDKLNNVYLLDEYKSYKDFGKINFSLMKIFKETLFLSQITNDIQALFDVSDTFDRYFILISLSCLDIGTTRYRLSDLLIDLTYSKYESSSNCGTLILLNEENDNIDCFIKFDGIEIQRKQELEYNNVLIKIRKLLQTTNNEFVLVFNRDRFIGIDYLKNYEEKKYLKIQYYKDNSFIMYKNNTENQENQEDKKNKEEAIIKYKNGKILLPKYKVSKTYFTKRLRTLSVDDNNINMLYNIISGIAEITKGTTIVLTSKSKAEEEVERIGDLCTPIDPVKLTGVGKKVLSGLTSIDGAMLIDTDGYCHAIGMILDGVYSKGGTSGRGSRYNSSNTYIRSKEDKNGKSEFLCITLSEDGHINYFGNKEN